jgi:hypothetical protein
MVQLMPVSARTAELGNQLHQMAQLMPVSAGRGESMATLARDYEVGVATIYRALHS